MNFKSLIITNEILQLIASIDEFKGTWQALGKIAPEQLSQLQKVATIESIGSSTRIEGSKLSDEAVKLLLSNIQIQKFETRDEQEVAGYSAVMNIIFEHYNEIEISENYINQLHSLLLQYSKIDNWHRGKYKTSPNHVVAFNSMGEQLGVIFETATPFETPIKMETLILWITKTIKEKSLHPLLIIAIFTVCFLAIHPYQDGNGRISRVITTFLLLKLGYQYVPYSSLESIIELQKKEYYLSLRQTQATFKNKNPNWQPWVLYFLKALEKQKDNLFKKVKQEHLILTKLPLLSQNIIALIKERGRITIGEILLIWQDAKRPTIKKHLENLVKLNQLTKHGNGKGTWYT